MVRIFDYKTETKSLLLRQYPRQLRQLNQPLGVGHHAVVRGLNFNHLLNNVVVELRLERQILVLESADSVKKNVF